jgi:hypothetical protein
MLSGLFLILFFQARKKRKKGILINCEEVEGVIVKQILEYNKDGGKVYYPVIEFEVDDCVKTEKYTDGYFPIKYFTNQKVIIQYSVNNPKEFLIKENKPDFKELIILLVGIGLIVYAFFLFYKIYFP